MTELGDMEKQARESELKRLRDRADDFWAQWVREKMGNRSEVKYSVSEFAAAFAAHIRQEAIEECAKFVEDFDEIVFYRGYYQQDNAPATLNECAKKLRELPAPPDRA